VKVHLQTQDYKNPLYRGTYDCLKKIIQKESLHGLYRGLSSPLASISVLNAIVFGVYGNVQRQTKDPESLFAHFCAGSAAGLSQTLICSPMELVKSRLQIQNDVPNAVKHKNPFQALKYLWSHEGHRGVFKGLGITVARDVPGLVFRLLFKYSKKLNLNYQFRFCELLRVVRDDDEENEGSERILHTDGRWLRWHLLVAHFLPD
jgi:hypothetical protein